MRIAQVFQFRVLVCSSNATNFCADFFFLCYLWISLRNITSATSEKRVLFLKLRDFWIHLDLLAVSVILDLDLGWEISTLELEKNCRKWYEPEQPPGG